MLISSSAPTGRFVRPGDRDSHPFALYERKYRPDQLRDEIGRWADEGGGQGSKPAPTGESDGGAGSSDPSNNDAPRINTQLAQYLPPLLRPLPLLSEPPVVPRPTIKPPLEEWPTNPREVPPGFEWKGRPGTAPGDKEGNYTKPMEPGDIKEPYLRYDETPGHKPHWDYRAPDGKEYRWYPDGTMEPKSLGPTIMFRLEA